MKLIHNDIRDLNIINALKRSECRYMWTYIGTYIMGYILLQFVFCVHYRQKFNFNADN